MAGLLAYYTPNQTTISRNEALIQAALIVACEFGKVVAVHSYMVGLMHLGMRVRVAACSLVYRKALKLSTSSLAESTVGQMVNLLSNDVSRFDQSVIHLHNLWGAPLEIILIMYLLYRYVDPSATLGGGFLVLFLPFQRRAIKH